jgi:hypothetical protein
LTCSVGQEQSALSDKAQINPQKWDLPATSCLKEQTDLLLKKEGVTDPGRDQGFAGR